MPRFLYTQARIPGRPERLARSFALLAPVDWYDFVPGALDANGAELPGLAVLLLFHGGNGTAEGAITDFQVEKMFDGTSMGKKLKLVIIAIQGISVGAGGGGDYNGGILGRELRAWVDDVSNVYEALEVAEQQMVERYIARKGEPPPYGTIFDRTRLAAWGFSNGGQMAYRVVSEVQGGWTFRAIVACSTTIGGWNSHASLLAGDPEDELWLPPEHVSILAIHGQADASIPPTTNGTGTNVKATTKAQLLDPLLWMEYARADVSGLASVDHYIAMNPTAVDVSLGFVPPVVLPASVTVARAFEIGATAWAAYFYLDSTLGHAYPDNTNHWGPGVASELIHTFLEAMVPLGETY